MNLQCFHIWSKADKPMFDFLVKVMCSVWIWAPGLRLPTHTAQIHKSLSWFTAGPKAVSVSSIWVRKKLRWRTHKADNDYFLRLSNQSKGPLDLDRGAPTWMDFDIYMRKARPLLRSQGTTLWYRSFDILDQIQSLVRATHPLRISRFILFHRISGQGYKLHVTSHCGDIEQNSSMEGGMDRRKEKMKGGTRMSQWVYCRFFSRPNVPHCRKKSTVPSCARLVMRVSNQANNYHPNRPTHTCKDTLSWHFYCWKRLCLVYLFTLYSPGP